MFSLKNKWLILDRRPVDNRRQCTQQLSVVFCSSMTVQVTTNSFNVPLLPVLKKRLIFPCICINILDKSNKIEVLMESNHGYHLHSYELSAVIFRSTLISVLQIKKSYNTLYPTWKYCILLGLVCAGVIFAFFSPQICL